MKRLKSFALSEDEIQIQYFNWVYAQERVYPALRWVHHIANGGSRHMLEAVKLKRMGVRPGVADVFIPNAHPFYDRKGLWIEFKSSVGKQSPQQKEFALSMSLCGYRYEICRTSQAAIEITKNYLNIK